MNNKRVLIVDDELFNRSLLSMLIPQLNTGFTIAGEATNITEAYALINELNPDVVFLDIKMPDGSGFDLFKKFASINFEVVFVTGFDEYSLKAFDYNALDYVLKPIDLDKLTHTLETISTRLQKQLRLKKIPVYYPDNVVLIAPDEVMYISHENDQTVFFKAPATKYVADKSFSDYEPVFLEQANFARVNNYTLVNLDFVAGYTAENNCLLRMKDGFEIVVAGDYETQVLEALKNVL